MSYVDPRPLEIIFSQSIIEGKLPDDWKKADITALHKKGTNKIQKIIDLSV